MEYIDKSISKEEKLSIEKRIFIEANEDIFNFRDCTTLIGNIDFRMPKLSSVIS